MGKINLSMTAVRQILMSSRSRGKTNSSVPQDEASLLQEIEAACNKFDTSKSGLMSEMDVVSVLSYVNISCQHDKENLNKYFMCVTCVTSSIDCLDLLKPAQKQNWKNEN